MKKLLLSIFFGLPIYVTPNIGYAQFIICENVKVQIGDTVEKFTKLCGKSYKKNEMKGGGRLIGKNNTYINFISQKRTFTDGSQVHFLFIDRKLAFILD